MSLKNKKQKKMLLKDIYSLSILIRKLSLYCGFISKSKSLDYKYIKSIINTLKIYIEKIEKNL